MAIFIKSLLTSMVFFTAIDLGWIKYVVQPTYKKYLSDYVADKPGIGAALGFYLFFLSGLVYFVIQPAVEKGSVTAAIIPGAIYGLVTYATYDLTAMAVLKNWPLIVTVTDMLWGMFLAMLVAVLSTWFMLKVV
ncbi:DUF2177 family protein [Candidatus Saccharibacteria bacterium]|jgi:uncharacterized membrane protein|nr:DUF2177 family protein [Candidatus Saccharibacteria bacterium]MBP9132083.1 DUF2177 family protein [Candidatus Saccharibacteria bacterium]